MTAVHQDTGVIDKLGPLDVLCTYHAPAGPTHAMFGQLMFPLQVRGKVRVGDEVKVLLDNSTVHSTFVLK